jgi:hypothetical protein
LRTRCEGSEISNLEGLKKRDSWSLTDVLIMVFQTRDTRWADVNRVLISVCRRMFSSSSLMRNMSCGCEGLLIDIIEDDVELEYFC